MKKALVLAGGFPQIALIEELKSRGWYVILADYNEAPVARSHADKFYRESTLDVDAIEKVARDEGVEMVITVCTDQALLTAATVSERLGLRFYISRETALNVTNKSYMKRVFMEKGIPTARFCITDGSKDSAFELDYPMVVKPVDCNSSKGVRKVTTPEELRESLQDACRLSRTGTAIVEEFIDGAELTVESYISGGRARVLAISNNEKIRAEGKFVIFRTSYPAAISEDIADRVGKIVQDIADAFHIEDSPLLVQMLCDGKRLNVIEFSARTGGGVKYLLIRNAAGFDVIKAVVDLTMGEKLPLPEIVRKHRYIVNDFIYCLPGNFDSLRGFEELKSEGILEDYYSFKWRGAAMGRTDSSGDRAAGFTVVGETPEELVAKHREALGRIEVLDENGRDIARHDLLPELCAEDGFVKTLWR